MFCQFGQNEMSLENAILNYLVKKKEEIVVHSERR